MHREISPKNRLLQALLKICCNSVAKISEQRFINLLSDIYIRKLSYYIEEVGEETYRAYLNIGETL